MGKNCGSHHFIDAEHIKILADKKHTESTKLPCTLFEECETA